MKRFDSQFPAQILLCDANVLIDYMTVSGFELIARICSCGYTIHVPDIVLFEVDRLSFEQAERIGLKVLPTPLSALRQDIRGLSLEDTACLYFVEKDGMVCVTNDKKLRATCQKHSGKVMWGLELLLKLVQQGYLPATEALEIVQNISRVNTNITPAILHDFEKKLSALVSIECSEKQNAYGHRRGYWGWSL